MRAIPTAPPRGYSGIFSRNSQRERNFQRFGRLLIFFMRNFVFFSFDCVISLLFFNKFVLDFEYLLSKKLFIT